jgi:hypothetical protein
MGGQREGKGAGGWGGGGRGGLGPVKVNPIPRLHIYVAAQQANLEITQSRRESRQLLLRTSSHWQRAAAGLPATCTSTELL